MFIKRYVPESKDYIMFVPERVTMELQSLFTRFAVYVGRRYGKRGAHALSLTVLKQVYGYLSTSRNVLHHSFKSPFPRARLANKCALTCIETSVLWEYICIYTLAEGHSGYFIFSHDNALFVYNYVSDKLNCVKNIVSLIL